MEAHPPWRPGQRLWFLLDRERVPDEINTEAYYVLPIPGTRDTVLSVAGMGAPGWAGSLLI